MDQVLFGFIGTGNMGGALAIAASKGAGPKQVVLANRTRAKAQALADQLGCWCGDNVQVAWHAKYIFLGVKPHLMEDMLAKISPILEERTDPFVLVSMAAGLSLERLQQMAGADCPILRIMPNTPVAVGEGMIFYARNQRVTDDDLNDFLKYMAPAGRFDPLEEELLDAGSAVAGCGPAFASMFLEALGDGAVACGLPRAKAYSYAAQMLLGTAALALQTGQHPGLMKDAVCSPGGSTIRGVQTLEEHGFRAAVFDAVCDACEKNRKLGEN